LAPTLPEIADEFGMTVGGVGQLRTVASVAGVVAALALAPAARRVPVRSLLRGGLALLAGGALVSGVAPSFAVLALGQLVIGVGVAAVLSSGLAAANDWSDDESRSRVLAWTIVGQPASWVVGLPIIGALSNLGWRWGWGVVPAAALLAAVALPCAPKSRRTVLRPRDTWRAWRDRRTRRWAFGELMAYAGWGGTLVYAGA
ncbi:MAG: MFS transporter, partial [Gaiellaceae bacterium]